MLKKNTLIFCVFFAIPYCQNIFTMLYNRSHFNSVVVETTGGKCIVYYKDCFTRKRFNPVNINPIPIEISGIKIWLKTHVTHFSMNKDIISMTNYNENDYVVTYRNRIIRGILYTSE